MEIVAVSEIEGVECEAIDVKAENPKSIMTLAKSLVNFINKKHPTSLGLAAPQVGIKRKLMVFRTNDNNFMVAINPSYYKNGSRVGMIEGCLSYPDEDFAIKRFKSVIARFITFDGKQQFKEIKMYLNGRAAVIFQHETDHLRGVTAATLGKKVYLRREEPVEAVESELETAVEESALDATISPEADKAIIDLAIKETSGLTVEV